MANTFLNKDGLSHLVSKLKTYIASQISAHTSNKSNPHGVTKSQVGLGSVANIDQSKAIKSITRSGTTFTATALDGTKTTFDQQDSNTTYGIATSSADGLMSKTDKAELDSVASTYATKSELSSHSQNASNPHKVTASQVGALPLSGGSLTGKLTVPSIENGSADANYFQTQKMRGQGAADTYYHAIDFGYAGHDRVDFYEYGGKYVFHKHTESDKSSGDIVIGEINSNGFVGKVNGHTINADVPAVSTVKSFTLSASSWSSGTYTISDSLITASSNQEILPAIGITTDQMKALQKAMITDAGQISGSLTIKALSTVPTIDIPIRVIFRGTI